MVDIVSSLHIFKFCFYIALHSVSPVYIAMEKKKEIIYFQLHNQTVNEKKTKQTNPKQNQNSHIWPLD